MGRRLHCLLFGLRLAALRPKRHQERLVNVKWIPSCTSYCCTRIFQKKTRVSSSTFRFRIQEKSSMMHNLVLLQRCCSCNHVSRVIILYHHGQRWITAITMRTAFHDAKLMLVHGQSQMHDYCSNSNKGPFQVYDSASYKILIAFAGSS